MWIRNQKQADGDPDQKFLTLSLKKDALKEKRHVHDDHVSEKKRRGECGVGHKVKVGVYKVMHRVGVRIWAKYVPPTMCRTPYDQKKKCVLV